MGFQKENIRQIRWLLVFMALLVLAIRYSDMVIAGVIFSWGIIKPFVYGGVIAFVLNIPMKGIEQGILGRWRNRMADKLKRPASLVLAILFLLLLVSVVVAAVVPQVTRTAVEVGNKIPPFIDGVVVELDKIARDYPMIQEEISKLEQININWETVIDSVFKFLKNGAGSVLTSTVNVAGSIIGGVVNLAIAFVFALYILLQKEKLGDQGYRIMTAFLPDKVNHYISGVLALLYKNFSNFITGQCLEAVILGTMFVIFMTIFRMPYALLVGVLIAFTALIPIVGAFIGCFVGAFLILMDNPLQALWFVILFLILQQIEGNLIYPKVVGNSVGLPSIWVLMAVSLGGSLFGIAGMLFFIPLLSTLYVLLRDSVNARNALKAGTQTAGQVAGEAGCGDREVGEREMEEEDDTE